MQQSPEDGRRRRRHLGDSAFALAGFAVYGASMFGLIALASRSLSNDAFSTYMVWIALTNLVGLAFAIFETYVPRVLIGSREPERGRAIMARFLHMIACADFVVAAVLVVANALGVFQPSGFGLGLTLLLALQISMMSLQSLQRGYMIGTERVRVFLLQFGTDGVLRLGLATCLVLAHSHSLILFACILPIASLTSISATTIRLGRWISYSAKGARHLVATRPLLSLAPAIIAPLILTNAAVPWLSAQDGISAAVIGGFAGGLTLSRVPTLIVGALVAPLLGPLSRAVESHHHEAYRHSLRFSQGIALCVGIGFTIATLLLGSFALSIFIGGAYQVGTGILVLLAFTSCLVLYSAVEQTALVANTAWRPITIAWIAGVVAFGLVLLSPISPVLAAALSGTVGTITTVAILTGARVRADRELWA